MTNHRVSIRGRPGCLRHSRRRAHCAERACLTVGLVLIVGAVGVAIYGYMRLKAPTPPPPEAIAIPLKPPPPRAPLAKQLLRNGETAAKVARTGKPQAIVLDVRPEDVEEILAPTLKDKGVQDLRVYFGDGTIACQGHVDLHDHSETVTARARPRVEDGLLKVDIIEAKIGSLPVPAKLSRAMTFVLEKKLNSQFHQKGRGAEVELTSVKVTPGRMVLRGKVAKD